MMLRHGTTRFRAEQIIRDSPNPRYLEPGGKAWNDGFSMNLEDGPFLSARSKSTREEKRKSFRINEIPSYSRLMFQTTSSKRP
jgi:hypothetical protein